VSKGLDQRIHAAVHGQHGPFFLCVDGYGHEMQARARPKPKEATVQHAERKEYDDYQHQPYEQDNRRKTLIVEHERGNHLAGACNRV
jgi:hypothetical protein